MSHQPISPEITFVPEHGGTKRIWKTFWLLTVVTIVELGLGLAIYNIHEGPEPNANLVLFFKGLMCILTLAKAWYIVAVFMHLGDELRSFVLSVVVPLLLLVWFIIAFLWDGDSWKDMKNTNAGSIKTEVVAPAAIEKGAKD
ncbi:MAG TPA: cytochrome C oxidase subunit IV family protein [Ferruginibacter sp.]|nr:cytochrome C oxidase subunit IV family protein [Ferruginibacter sp.]HRO06252.1 cytochrome C oxidase subunit IV family protein [Ferruginibacter sp.]HRO97003.1 cytochrome C oxidase subunit IV family protein [Ferruginibacter sp.]HRP49635.1 cytochrome C oxidase subunit IV family protein [Ferruginibacter sp.]